MKFEFPAILEFEKSNFSQFQLIDIIVQWSDNERLITVIKVGLNCKPAWWFMTTKKKKSYSTKS